MIYNLNAHNVDAKLINSGLLTINTEIIQQKTNFQNSSNEIIFE